MRAVLLPANATTSPTEAKLLMPRASDATREHTVDFETSLPLEISPVSLKNSQDSIADAICAGILCRYTANVQSLPHAISRATCPRHPSWRRQYPIITSVDSGGEATQVLKWIRLCFCPTVRW